MDKLAALVAAFLQWLKQYLPSPDFVEGFLGKTLVDEAQRQAIKAQVSKEAYETYGDNLELDDAELRDRVRQRIDRGEYL